MRKKLLAIVTLLCSAVLCVGAGIDTLQKDEIIVGATTGNTTWTDDSTGVTYTLDYDRDTGYYTDLGDLFAPYEVSTEAGKRYSNITQRNANPDIDNVQAKDGSFVMTNASGMLTQTSGIAFQVRTDNVWKQVAGMQGTTSRAASTATRISIYYGDTLIYLVRGGGIKNNVNLNVEVLTSSATGTYDEVVKNSTGVAYVFENFFEDGKMKDGWMEVKLSKIQCTAISDGSAAKGYWMRMTMKVPGADAEAVIVNQFFKHEANDKSNVIAIKNETIGYSAASNFVATNSAEQGYRNNMYIRRADGNYINTATYYEEEVSYDASYFGYAYGSLTSEQIVALADGETVSTSASQASQLTANDSLDNRSTYKPLGVCSPTFLGVASAKAFGSSSVGVSLKVAPQDGLAFSANQDNFLGGCFSNMKYYFSYGATDKKLTLTVQQENSFDGKKYVYEQTNMGTNVVRYVLATNFDTSVAHTYEITRRRVSNDATAYGQGYLLSVYIDKGTANAIEVKLVSGFTLESVYYTSTLGTMFGKNVVVGDAYPKTQSYTDFGELHDDFAYGVEQQNSARWSEPNARKVGAVDVNDGIEFRFKHTVAGNMADASANRSSWMRIEVGTSSVLMGLLTSGSQRVIGFEAFNSANNFVDQGIHLTDMIYDPTAEYMMRVTRTALNNVDTLTNKGSIIRVYLAKVGTENWDDKPVAKWLDTGFIRNQTGSTTGGAESLEVHAVTQGSHSIYFSSNKYVGVKTVVDSETVVNRVVRGENFTLPTVGGLVAWENEDTIVKNGATLTNVTQSVTYNALKVSVKDSAYASLRFRPIDANKELTVDNIQVSIKWTAQVNRADVEVLANKLGATAEIGYVITKHGATVGQDRKSPEMAVESFAGDTFAVLQSGIDESNYQTKFSMQSYVKFVLSDNSTIYVWGEVNEDGYTQNKTTVQHIVNGAWETALGEQGEEYCYEVEEGVYSCYDATLYAVLKRYYQAMNANV